MFDHVASGTRSRIWECSMARGWVMDEKQIAEIDARIAPILRAIDTFIDSSGVTWDDTSLFRESTYAEIYKFCKVVMEQFGKLSPRNEYILRVISGNPGANIDENQIVDSTYIDTLSIGFKANKQAVIEYLSAGGDKHNPEFLATYGKYSNIYV